MPDFTDHSTALRLLKEAQDAEHDMREYAREAHLFINKRDGQWEPFWWNTNANKPRYTFDITTPIIDQIAGEMEQADFDIMITPAGGEATKDTALLYDGIVRNIETISNASNTYNQATRSMLTGGIDGWEVVQKFVDGNSMDQDLIIEPIANYIDRVWHDPAAERQDKSDSTYAFMLQAISKDYFETTFKKDREGESIETDKMGQAYYHKPNLVVVGKFYYIKPEKRELVLMSNGHVHEVDEKYNQVKDNLLRLGITEKRRRIRNINKVYIRFFDNKGWLGPEKATVFSYIPIVPIYGNYQIYENKTIYWGAVEKLLDPQRIFNYSMSREIEEGALAPRAKYWMTQKQASGHEETLATLNTNSDPVQFYNHDPDAPGAPPQIGGAQINPGLRTISEAMRQVIGQSAGMFAANMGDNPGLQSGIAIRQLQNKGDNGTYKYTVSREIAICHTGKILIDAIPKAYDAERQIRILKEDGSFDLTTVNEVVIDEETGKPIVLNDLSQGTYDVTCKAGPAFRNRQEELLTKIVDFAKIDPSVITTGSDIILNNIQAPGMGAIAERKRRELFSAGLIPQDQMTDEELAQLEAAAQQPQQPDAMTLAAQAEIEKARADQAKVEADFTIESERNALKREELRIKELELQVKVEQLSQKDTDQAISAAQKQQEFDLKLEKMRQDLALSISEQNRKNDETASNIEKQNAEILKILKEAIGVKTIIGPGNMEAYIEKAEDISEGIEPEIMEEKEMSNNS